MGPGRNCLRQPVDKGSGLPLWSHIKGPARTRRRSGGQLGHTDCAQPVRGAGDQGVGFMANLMGCERSSKHHQYPAESNTRARIPYSYATPSRFPPHRWGAQEPPRRDPVHRCPQAGPHGRQRPSRPVTGGHRPGRGYLPCLAGQRTVWASPRTLLASARRLFSDSRRFKRPA